MRRHLDDQGQALSEQARGESADKRADVWAFGAALYEMLTGCRPFEGRTLSDTLASVLAREPTRHARKLIVVENRFDEVKRLVPSNYHPPI